LSTEAVYTKEFFAELTRVGDYGKSEYIKRALEDHLYHQFNGKKRVE
jgi:hypothetical protein